MCSQSRIFANGYDIVSGLIFVLIMGFSSPAWSGIIRTTISSHYTITGSGALELRFEIQNEGNATAHKMAATLTLSNVRRSFPDLGENPPDGTMTLKDRIECPGWKPGVYAGVITVSFEEQNGTSHSADHFFTVQYRIKSEDLRSGPLKLRADNLVFNANAFWRKEEPLRVTLKNTGDKFIKPELQLYLPEGFGSPDAASTHALPPEGESVVTLPVVRNKNAEPNKILHLFASYDFNGWHYIFHLQEVIRMEKKPFFFRLYVMGSGVVILIFGGVLIVRRKVTGSE